MRTGAPYYAHGAPYYAYKGLWALENVTREEQNQSLSLRGWHELAAGHGEQEAHEDAEVRQRPRGHVTDLGQAVRISVELDHPLREICTRGFSIVT